MNTILVHIGSVVRNHRRQLGISQEELADRSGLHRTYITDVERGNRNLTIGSMTKLAKALDVTLDEFFVKVEKFKRQPHQHEINPLDS